MPITGLRQRKTPYDILLSLVRNTLIEGQERIEEERVRTYWCYENKWDTLSYLRVENKKVNVSRFFKLSPLQLLAAFVEKIGCPLRVGNRNKKLFLKEDVLVDRVRTDGNWIQIVDEKDTAEYSQCFWFWLTPIDSQMKIEIALAYCIEDWK